MSSPSHSSVDENEGIFQQVETNFKPEALKEALKSQFSNPKNKITEDALTLTNEILKALVIEASIRASKQSSLQSKNKVTLQHIESILPQLMLDFP